jgi:hypothetical protein
MTLAEFIASLNLTGSADEIAATLNAATVTQTNSTLQRSSDMILALGETNAEIALTAFETAMAGSAILRSQYQALNGQGLDFSNALVQATITSLVAGGLPSGIGASLAAMGIQQISPYQQWAGVGQSPVTADQVTAAQATLVQDGVAFSLVISVTPQMPCAIHMSRTALCGAQPMGILENFSTSQAVNANLTSQQQALVTAILALVNSYGS